MNREQLRARLVAEGFKQGTYSLEGEPFGYEGFALSHKGKEWIIEHYERGSRRIEDAFSDEERACAKMYELMERYYRK